MNQSTDYTDHTDILLLRVCLSVLSEQSVDKRHVAAGVVLRATSALDLIGVLEDL